MIVKYVRAHTVLDASESHAIGVRVPYVILVVADVELNTNVVIPCVELNLFDIRRLFQSYGITATELDRRRIFLCVRL